MMNNIIEVKNLGISYPNNGFSLKNISFTVPKGSIVGIIGENGSGDDTFDEEKGVLFAIAKKFMKTSDILESIKDGKQSVSRMKEYKVQ